jgi:hypothetical protein
MQFKNPQNDYVETSSVPLLWALLFGPLYFVFKGAYRHFVIFALLAIPISIFIHPVLVMFIWIVYAFLAPSIIQSSYLRRGWVEIKPDPNIDPFIGNVFKIDSDLIFSGFAIAVVAGCLVVLFGK